MGALVSTATHRPQASTDTTRHAYDFVRINSRQPRYSANGIVTTMRSAML
jgi:hypothetical protein